MDLKNIKKEKQYGGNWMGINNWCTAGHTSPNSHGYALPAIMNSKTIRDLSRNDEQKSVQ
jgi:hypothetical protein